MIHWLNRWMICVFFVYGGHVNAGVVTVAVAANFSSTLNQIALEFFKETGHKIQPAVESTGMLYAQIEQGAPFDIFLAADAERPNRLVVAGLADSASQFTYALGRLALWTPGSDLAPSLEDIDPSEFRYLAIANPRLAPYGEAAEAVLTHWGLFDRWQNSLVFGQNIGATFTLMVSGNASAGFVALSQLIAEGISSKEYTVMAEEMHLPIAQNAVLTQQGLDSPIAIALMSYLQSPAAKELIAAAGYGVPAA